MNEITQTTALTPQQQYEMAQKDAEAHNKSWQGEQSQETANDASESAPVRFDEPDNSSGPISFDFEEEETGPAPIRFDEFEDDYGSYSDAADFSYLDDTDIPSVTPYGGLATTWEELNDENNPYLKMQKYLDSLKGLTDDEKVSLSTAYTLALDRGFDPDAYESTERDSENAKKNPYGYAARVQGLKEALKDPNLSQEDREYYESALETEKRQHRKDEIYLKMYRTAEKTWKKSGKDYSNWTDEDRNYYRSLAEIPDPEEFYNMWVGNSENSDDDISSGYGTVSDDRESSITDSKYSGYKENAKNSNIAKNYNAGMGKEVEEAVSDKYCKIFRTVLKSEPDYIRKVLIAIPKNHAESEW